MVDLTKPIGKCTAQELAAAILLNAGPGRFNPQQVLTKNMGYKPRPRRTAFGIMLVVEIPT